MMRLGMWKRIKEQIIWLANDCRGEYAFRIEPSKFTPEQRASFDRIVDFLARMVEKYSPAVDDILNRTNKNTEKQAV